MEEAIRTARLALDAAEKMSKALSNEKVNQELVDTQYERPNPDASVIDLYRRMVEGSQRAFIDGEVAYLRAAKLLNSMPDATYKAALGQLEDEISRSGVSRTNRVFEAIDVHIPKVPADATRIDAEFRAQLEALQNP
jgi:hypothetical protein